MTPLEKYLGSLRDNLTRAQKAESLVVCHNCGHAHDGYPFLKEELNKVLDALKETAVSPKSLESQVDHAATVGAHNAIRSLLQVIDDLAARAPKISAQVQQVEADNEEELKRLGNEQA